MQPIYHLFQFGIEEGNYKLVQEVVKTQCISSKGILIYFETLNVVQVIGMLLVSVKYQQAKGKRLVKFRDKSNLKV